MNENHELKTTISNLSHTIQDRTEDLAKVLKFQDKNNNNRELKLKIGDMQELI